MHRHAFPIFSVPDGGSGAGMRAALEKDLIRYLTRSMGMEAVLRVSQFPAFYRHVRLRGATHLAMPSTRSRAVCMSLEGCWMQLGIVSGLAAFLHWMAACRCGCRRAWTCTLSTVTSSSALR